MKKVLRLIVIIAGVIIVFVILLVLLLLGRSSIMANKSYDAPQDIVTIPTDGDSLARGQHLVSVIAVCVDCHGENFAGNVIVDDPALGRITALNLTSGQNGLGEAFSDADFVRAIRYGVTPDGKSVRIMPADDYYFLSDSDLGAIIAYIRSLPGVDNDLPLTQVKPFGRILVGAGQLPIFIAERINTNDPRPEPAPAVSLDYGTYLAHIAGCIGCHGPGLSGGTIPGTPPDFPQAANLTPSGEVGQWSEADFIQTIRTGINPAGHQLLSEMPWQRYGGMTDEELQAIWLFVSSVPAKEFGNR